MSLDKAIASGVEHRRPYEARGLSGAQGCRMNGPLLLYHSAWYCGWRAYFWPHRTCPHEQGTRSFDLWMAGHDTARKEAGR